MAETLTLKVSGEKTMHCGGCEHSVTSTLTQLPGVQNAKADRNTQEIEVVLHSTETNLSSIQAELQEMGYQVESVQTQ